jgi:hypothetical protein
MHSIITTLYPCASGWPHLGNECCLCCIALCKGVVGQRSTLTKVAVWGAQTRGLQCGQQQTRQQDGSSSSSSSSKQSRGAWLQHLLYASTQHLNVMSQTLLATYPGAADLSYICRGSMDAPFHKPAVKLYQIHNIWYSMHAVPHDTGCPLLLT